MDKELQELQTRHPEYFANGLAYADTNFRNLLKFNKIGKLNSLVGINTLPAPGDTAEISKLVSFLAQSAQTQCYRDLDEKKIEDIEGNLKAFIEAFSYRLKDLLSQPLQ